MPNDDALLIEAGVIKNETGALQNTAVRVGNMLVDVVTSKLSQFPLSVSGTNTYTATTTVISSYLSGNIFFLLFVFPLTEQHILTEKNAFWNYHVVPEHIFFSQMPYHIQRLHLRMFLIF
jgi:hypothetical protein